MTIKVNYSIGDIFISVEGECPEEVLKVVEGLTGEKKIPQEDEEESL